MEFHCSVQTGAMAEVVEDPRSERHRFVALAVPVTFLFSLVVVVMSAWNGKVTVGGRADLHRVDFGWPVAWVHQDQSSMDPPFPSALSFNSPWEHPTTVSPAAFLGDVLVVFAALGVLVMLTAALTATTVRRARSLRGPA